MKIVMTARLSVKSHRKGVFGNVGKSALMTWGILSPTIIQKAIMPPKALNQYSSALSKSQKRITYKAH